MRKQIGFTLMEVMITVAIVAILASIAVPSYLSYVTESRHREAKSAILELGQFMERRYTANDRYNNDDDSMLTVADLPFQALPRDGGTAYYNVSIVESTKDTYELAIIPTGSMDGDVCGNYTLNQKGEHTTASPANTTCW